MMRNSHKNIVHTLQIAVAMFFVSAFLTRCANILSPNGGPRDTLPPVIIGMTPDNFTTNRPLTNHERIVVTFNEYVQIKDQQKEFFTSPHMKKKPLLTMRGKSVVIQLRDTLSPNITYSLNFGSSLRDNNEGNPLYSMRYVFSTGDKIDSMVLSGYTADSYKADSVSKSFIWFYPADSVPPPAIFDSTIFNHKPAAIARAENNGIFIAQNLKPINYRIYAIQDKNDNQMYEPGTDQVGFLDSIYNPASLPEFGMWFDSLRHYVVAEPQLYFRMFTDRQFRRQTLSQSERPLQHKAMLYFGSARPKIESLTFDNIPSDKIIIEPITVGRDTLALWFNMPAESLPDTIKGEITYHKHDSLSVLQPFTEKLKLGWKFIESKDQERERERLEKEKKKAEEAGEPWKEPIKKNPFTFKMPTSGEINPEENLTIEFDYPVVKLDTSSLLLTVNQNNKVEDVQMRIARDTGQMRRYHIRTAWKLGGEYTLTIPQGAITDVAGLSNDSIVGKYTVADPEKYATIKIKIAARDPQKSYIIQQTDANGGLKQQKTNLKAGEVEFKYIPAGEIKFRVIEDNNNNGKWDGGDLVARRQPERAEMFRNDDGKDIFVTKVNWEMDQIMDMDRIFAPVTMQSLSRMLDQREIQRLQREAEKRLKDGPKENKNNNNNNNNSNQGRMNENMNSTGNMFNNTRR